MYVYLISPRANNTQQTKKITTEIYDIVASKIHLFLLHDNATPTIEFVFYMAYNILSWAAENEMYPFDVSLCVCIMHFIVIELRHTNIRQTDYQKHFVNPVQGADFINKFSRRCRRSCVCNILLSLKHHCPHFRYSYSVSSGFSGAQEQKRT